MKTIILFLFICASLSAQVNEKRAIKETHIDFSKEHIEFILHGQIEIDGHTFLNDTCKNPIYYIANLEGIKILNKATNQEYLYRKCDKQGCKVIHLNLKVIQYPDIFNNLIPYNNLLKTAEPYIIHNYNIL